IREPGLSSLAFASDPVAHQEALVGRTLFLNRLPHEEGPAIDRQVIRRVRGVAGRLGTAALDAKVELVQPGELREVNPRMPCGAPRSVNWALVIVYETIAVERHPMPQERQPVVEVEGSKPRSGIVGAEFLISRHIREAEEAV